MLKNKLKIVTLLIVIILALTIPIVRAEDENVQDIATTTAVEEVENSTLDNFKTSDVYLVGDDVVIDYIVDGNLFVVANNVTITSQIGGDAFICSNTVTVEEQGYVFSNLFTFSENVNIKGVVYDLYAASKNTTITGYVYRDIRVDSDTVNIFGTVGRNAFIDCVNINFTQGDQDNDKNKTTLSTQGIVSGNLSYTSKEETSIPEGAVSGEIKFEQEKSSNSNTITDYIMSLLTMIATVIAIWLLCLWLKPKFLNNTTSLTTKRILPVIGLGILTPIVVVVVSILLLVLGVTASLGLLLLATLFILLAISTSLFVITVNTIVCNKLKIQKTIAVFGMLVVCTSVLWLIGLIPYLGTLVDFIIIILGLGITVTNILFKEKTDKSKKENKKTATQKIEK